MARYAPPEHYNELLASGTLTFYESGTNTLKSIYADNQELIPIANPVSLGVNGEEPNIFYSGAARVVAKNADGEQVFDRDPVGGASESGNFTLHDLVTIYSANELVLGNDGKYYRSLQNDNQGNDPTLSSGNNAFWEEVRFIGIYNLAVSYSLGDVVQTTDGLLWRSLSNANLANSPMTSASNWATAGNVLRDDGYTNVIPKTGGGLLAGLRINEIRDGGAYTLPLANEVLANQTITIDLPERYRNSVPVISVTGGDTITASTGTDTSITYDSNSFGKIVLTSDGANNWSI